MSTTPPLSATSENLASRVIDFVRFPLAFLVVTIHVTIILRFPDGVLQDFPCAYLYQNLTGGGIARIAVPLFFFISGYLFFLNTSHTSIVGGVSQRALHSPGRGAEPARQEQAQGREHDSFPCSLYFKKLKKRFWSLFVPLAVWGTMSFVVVFLADKLGIQFLDASKTFDYSSVLEFARDFFVRGILAGDLGVFWFIRGLIIACILSPLWFFLLKKFKLIPLIIFGIWYCLFPNTSRAVLMGSFGSVVVFFFCFGAYFSIHGIDFTKVFSKIRILLFVAYPILLIGDAILKLFGFTELYDKISNFEAMIGVVAAIALVSLFLEKRPSVTFPKTLFSATFFVYAGHEHFLYLPHLFVFPKLFSCETSLDIIVAFLCSTIFAVVCCVLFSILVRKFAPWSIRFLTGGR